MAEGSFRDAFSELPVEIMCIVLSNLNAFYAGIPNGTGLHYREPIVGQRLDVLRAHPFLSLAATSRRLCEVVESHCRSLLLQNQSIIKFKPIDEGRKQKKKQRMSYRGYWRKFTRRKCAFCGTTTTRGAMFNCLIHCCHKCDLKEWPMKITRSMAVRQYKLDLEDLINPFDNHIVSFEPERGGMWPGGLVRPLKAWPETELKTLRHALYRGAEYEATMFFLHEVRERAAIMHGDCLIGDSVDRSRREGVADAGLKGNGASRKGRKRAETNHNGAENEAERDVTCS